MRTDVGDDTAPNLRREAENKVANSLASSPGRQSIEETQATVHELQVHQAELEIQNEELRRMQLELEGSRARYFDLYDRAPVGYFTLSELGLIIEANLTAANLLGAARRELAQQPLRTFVLPDDQDLFYHHRRRLLLTGEPQVDELRMFGPKGEPVWVRLDGVLAPAGADWPIWRAVVTDISAQKQVEAELERKISELAAEKDRAQAATTAKSQFLSLMSHEIRTPLNGILGMTELLLDDGLTGEAKGHALTIRDAGAALLSIINDILDFSKIEAGRMDLAVATFDLSRVVQEVVELMSVKAHEKRLELVLSYAPEAARAFEGDALRLRQIVLNLVSNAIKFTRKGRVSVEVSCAAFTDKTDTMRIAVRDTGIGIPPARRELLFQRFNQLDVSTTHKYGGSGLGLAISKQLVELMGGKIEVESQPGRGTVFTVEIPLARHSAEQSTAAPLPSGAQGVNAQPRSWAGTRVLVVDDNLINQRVASAMLLKLGCTVELAANGREGLTSTLGSAAPYDMIFMDCQMPEMDGYEATLAIRKSEGTGKHTPVVALTASALPEDRQRCLEAGMDGYLTKPVSITALRAALSEWLDPPASRSTQE